MVTAVEKITCPPEQAGLDEQDMEALTCRKGLNVTAYLFESAGFPVVQVRFETSWQKTVSPAVGV